MVALVLRIRSHRWNFVGGKNDILYVSIAVVVKKEFQAVGQPVVAIQTKGRSL